MIQIIDKSFYTVDEVAESMKVTKEAVRGWCRDGKLKATKFGKRFYIPAKSLKEVLEVNYQKENI